MFPLVGINLSDEYNLSVFTYTVRMNHVCVFEGLVVFYSVILVNQIFSFESLVHLCHENNTKYHDIKDSTFRNNHF